MKTVEELEEENWELRRQVKVARHWLIGILALRFWHITADDNAKKYAASALSQMEKQ